MVEIIHSQPGRRFQERYRRMHSKTTRLFKRLLDRDGKNQLFVDNK